MLLSNKWTDAYRSLFKLLTVVRTQFVSEDSFGCVYETEDAGSHRGVRLSKDIVKVAGRAMEKNFTTLGPYVLPVSEQLKTGFWMAVRFLAKRTKAFLGVDVSALFVTNRLNMNFYYYSLFYLLTLVRQDQPLHPRLQARHRPLLHTRRRPRRDRRHREEPQPDAQTRRRLAPRPLHVSLPYRHSVYVSSFTTLIYSSISLYYSIAVTATPPPRRSGTRWTSSAATWTCTGATECYRYTSLIHLSLTYSIC